MSPTLPFQPSLEHLKRQAKDLLRAHQQGDVAACAPLRQLHYFTHASDTEILAAPLTLRQAQHAVAKEYGFANWVAMKTTVETLAPPNTVTGGCLCGAVRYSIDDPSPKATICYCAGCRRASAAPVVAWITVPAISFQLLQGELRKIRAEGIEQDSCDGHGGERGFCPMCGTHITFIGDGRQHEVDITTGSLDDPNRFPPVEASFAAKKLTWMKSLIG